MTQENEKRLRELLGEEFSREEIAEILREEPELLEAAGPLLEQLRGMQPKAFPELRADFTARVVERLESVGMAKAPPRRWGFVPIFGTASVLAASLALVLYLGHFREPSLGTPLSVREAQGPDRQKIFFVRFALKQPGAKQVALAGDFNQWNPAPLTASVGEDGVFAVEVPLGEGTYSYNFVVDGQRWVPDPAADRWVDDGFGQRNSVINL